MKNFALHNAILEKETTQREIANKSGVPEPYISETIHGRRILSEYHQVKVAEALGKKREDVFGENQSCHG